MPRPWVSPTWTQLAARRHAPEKQRCLAESPQQHRSDSAALFLILWQAALDTSQQVGCQVLQLARSSIRKLTWFTVLGRLRCLTADYQPAKRSRGAEAQQG